MRFRSRSASFVVLVALVAMPFRPASGGDVHPQRVVFVDLHGPADGDGASWATAVPHLADALAIAPAHAEIRVAGGVHRPDRTAHHPEGSGYRGASFVLRAGQTLKGGYAGLAHPVGSDLRDPARFRTVLSGDLRGDDGPDWTNMADNAFHILRVDDAPDVTIDGLVVERAFNDGYNGEENWRGGGVRCTGATSLHMRDVQVLDCRGYYANALAVLGTSAGDFTLESCDLLRAPSVAVVIERAGRLVLDGVRVDRHMTGIVDALWMNACTVRTSYSPYAF